MKNRALKTTLAILAVLGGILAAWEYLVPDYHDATYRDPTSGVQIVLRLVPSHPYLAEYDRTVLLRSNSGRKVQVDLFPDTGGYSRTQLYRVSNTRYWLKGSFDSAMIDVSTQSIEVRETLADPSGTYLGAFARDTKEGWRFLPASVSPEASLEPKGG
jgi:hypothetical protein